MQRDLFWFDRPSRDFAGINAALAFGNGYMGGQVEDNLVFETITLNESTMFTGAPYENHVEGACRYLEELRKKRWRGSPATSSGAAALSACSAGRSSRRRGISWFTPTS